MRDYVARLKKAGANVELVAYPGTYDAFDVQTIPGTLQLPQAQTWRKCRFEEKPQGVIINSDTGQPASFNDSCIERGVTIAYSTCGDQRRSQGRGRISRQGFQQLAKYRR